MALTKAKGHILADDLALGGNPTTSTQSTGNNTTRVATTAFVQTELAALGDSAPAALNTLNELAAAMGDDANFSTTITNSIAAKAPLSSPDFLIGAGEANGVEVHNANGQGITIFTDTTAANADVFIAAAAGAAAPLKFKNGGTERLAITTSGIDVSGQIITDAGALSAPSYSFTGDTDTGMSRPTTNAINFVTAGAERMRILADGKTGIGTTSPSQALEVTGITLSDGYRTAADNTNYSLFTRNSSNTAVYIQQAGSGTILDVQSGSAGAGQGTSKLLVNSSGITVTGTINTSGTISSTVASGGGVYHSINHSGSEAWTWAAQNGSGSTDYLDVGISGGTRAMSWQEDGNVGIGTTSPDRKLEVSGTDIIAKFQGTNSAPPQIEFADSTGVQAVIGLNTGHDFIIDTAGENVHIGPDAASLGAKTITILANGFVGVGTVSPTDPLTIHNGTPSIKFKDTSSNGEAFWALDGVNMSFYNKSSAGEMSFGTVNARRMSITQYGALHIDTSTSYSNKQWLNENTAASPQGGSTAAQNTYLKTRLWADGDINLNQGRGLHFGDVTDAAPLCIREGVITSAGVDKDKIWVYCRGEFRVESERSRVSPGDSSTAGTGRTTSTQMVTNMAQWGTWEEVITTPNGGDQTCRIVQDWSGRWILVGRFAADASTSICGTWSSVRGLSTSTGQSQATQFSADWGDIYPSEVRVMGATDFDNYYDTRTIDFVYGNRPSGAHTYVPRQWKHFFSGSNVDGMTNGAGGAPKWGFSMGYSYDGKGRWYNPNQHGMGMSDANTTNPRAAYTAPVSNAFNWNGAADAKLLATHYRTKAAQDDHQTTGFGKDDNIIGFYDSYPVEYSNMGGAKDGGGVHTALSSAVWIMIKLQY